MLNYIKKIAVLSLLAPSFVFAGTSTIDFGGVTDLSNRFNQFSVTQSGVTVNVSGWSDTYDQNGRDDIIERAGDLDKYNGGWSIQNADEISGARCGNGHSADNFTRNCGGNNNFADYDFFLLEFSHDVSLTGANYSWVNGHRGTDKKWNRKAAKKNQVSVVALDNNNLNGNTWQNIKDNSTISSDYAQVKYASGYFTNFSTTDVAGTESKYWLIGALNSVFGGNFDDEGNDGIKLASVGFNKKSTPPTEVPSPSTLFIFALGLLGLANYRQRKTK